MASGNDQLHAPYQALLHVGECFAEQLNALEGIGLELRPSNNGMMFSFEGDAHGLVVVVHYDHDGAWWVADLR